MDEQEGVSIRPVKLKVLYTFDSEHRNNHLARWPQTLEVQTAQLDEVTKIGVVALRTCLQAITTASPELASEYGNDFTVYAFDYSEPDTPLVGQGMLSTLQSSEEEDRVLETEAMVTGLISRNVMGLFSKNAQETLEVKLRLTPVAMPQRPRSGSIASQEGVQQWLSNPSIPQSATSPVNTTGLEAMQKMLSQGGAPRGHGSRPTSRPGTPTQDKQSTNRFQRDGPPPPCRPNSRASNRQPQHARRDSFNSGYFSAEDATEEGPAPKRAKITKVDWPNKTELNIERPIESLRVQASTASSVRLHRPIAINPVQALENPSTGEEPVRPPTPVPTKTGRPRGRPRKKAQSNLFLSSRVHSSSPAPMSAPAVPQPVLQPESLVSSPEEVRAKTATSTPADLPSSPPVFLEPKDAVTSPILPPLHADQDSGFMSGNLDDLFGDDSTFRFDDFINDKVNFQADFLGDVTETYANQTVAVGAHEQLTEPEPASRAVSNAPTTANQSLTSQPLPAQRAQSFTDTTDALLSPKLPPVAIPRLRPPVPITSDLVKRPFQRANTWAPDTSDALMSEALAIDDISTEMQGDGGMKPAQKKRLGREQTRARLEAAIAAGEMPPFCDNCGEIETPAWRKAWVRVFTCPWDEVETSLTFGECCYKIPLDTDKDGTIKTFKGLKAENPDKSTDWTQVDLCNPCGLWFNKNKCPRPQKRWTKDQPKEKRKRRKGGPKGGRKKKSAKVDDPTPTSDDSSPTDSTTIVDTEDTDYLEINEELGVHAAEEPQLPSMPRAMRAHSMDAGISHVQVGRSEPQDKRVTQSSPTRGHGSEAEPIEVGFTPSKSVRRQLFPSPNKGQICSEPIPATTVHIASVPVPTLVRRSPRLNKNINVFAHPSTATAVVALTPDGKENTMPALAIEDSLFDLFGEGEIDLFMPTTPTPKRRSERLLLKSPSTTPLRAFGTEVSPNVHTGLSPFRTPKLVSNRHPVASALLGTAIKDPSQMTPLSRSIHDALESFPALPEITSGTSSFKTPKRRSPKNPLALGFPDLPNLEVTATLSDPINLNFSELTTEQMQEHYNDVSSSEGPMASSPPPGFFDFINSHEVTADQFWDEWTVNGQHEQAPQSEYPDPEEMFLNVPAANDQQLRRSPRKHN